VEGRTVLQKTWVRIVVAGVCALLLAWLVVPRLLVLAGVPAFVYAGCAFPDSIAVRTVEVNPYLVAVSGSTIASAMSYQGFVYRVEGDVLKLGLRYSLKASESGGAFDVRIALPDQRISAVYLTDGNSSKRIYP